LFLFGVRKHQHRVNDLDSRICIEINALFFWPPVSINAKNNQQMLKADDDATGTRKCQPHASNRAISAVASPSPISPAASHPLRWRVDSFNESRIVFSLLSSHARSFPDVK